MGVVYVCLDISNGLKPWMYICLGWETGYGYFIVTSVEI